MRIRLSVNINKIALIRNSRGGNYPDILKISKDLEHWGCEGITIHPRPDERHIRYNDVYALKEILKVELNVEGNPTSSFVKMCLEAKPTQVTLVPDLPDALTSSNGWDTIQHKMFLTDVIQELKSVGTRVSIFVNPDEKMVEGALACNTDCIELYTEDYAKDYHKNREEAIKPYKLAYNKALEIGIKHIHAGHDLNLDNLSFFKQELPLLSEVSIGHAFVTDSLYYGLQNTLRQYMRLLN